MRNMQGIVLICTINNNCLWIAVK